MPFSPDAAVERADEVSAQADVACRPIAAKKKERRIARWDSRPAFGTPEWLRLFEEVVKTSKTRNEAVGKLGYANPSVVYYHMKKFGIEHPPEWNLKPAVSRQRRGRVPDEIFKNDVERAWVASLIQGEGCIKTHYSKKTNSTAIEIGVAMADPHPHPITRFSDLTGVTRPKKATPKEGPFKPMWYGRGQRPESVSRTAGDTPVSTGAETRRSKEGARAIRTRWLPRGLCGRIRGLPRKGIPPQETRPRPTRSKPEGKRTHRKPRRNDSAGR